MIVAIDIGGTKTIIGLIRASGQIVHQQRFLTLPHPEHHLAQCLTTMETMMQRHAIVPAGLAGVGVTLPGLVDVARGVLVHAPYLGWRDVPVVDMIRRSYPALTVRVANDVDGCAHGERVFGHGKNCPNLVWVTVSTGIGAGIVVDGAVYGGHHGIAGELGHVVVEWNEGQTCPCGNRGCLEAHASGTAIARMAAEQGLALTAELLAERARAGHPVAVQVFEQAGEYLGRGLSYAANLLNPGMIVLGGGVSQSFDLFYPRLRAVYEGHVMGASNRDMRIQQTALGYEAGLLGAASLVVG